MMRAPDLIGLPTATSDLTPPSNSDRVTPITRGGVETLLSGRGLGLIGVLLMLVGCAYFLDLSFARGWIGPAQRIALGILGGSLLVTASARFLRGTYRIVAEGTVGLGASLLYLSTWAAIVEFPDLHVPRVAGFLTMIVVTGVLALLANVARSQPLALMGLSGAYLTPILLATGTPDRTILATYLFIVTAAMLVLARRRSFVAVEITAIVAPLLFGGEFIPSILTGWSNGAAAIVTSCFTTMFLTAFTIRPVSGRYPSLRLVPFILTGALYVALLEMIFHAEQNVLGATLSGFAGLLFVALRSKHVPAAMTPAYHIVGVLALNLAMRAFVHPTELFTALSIEAAVLVLFGSRTSNASLVRVGFGLLTVAAVGLLWEARTFAPAAMLFTPLALGFVAWTQAAFSVRRAIPAHSKSVYSVVTHLVTFVGATRIVLDATGGAYWNVAQLPNLAQCSISIAWALFAAALFLRGVTSRDSVARWEGLVLFAITTAKVLTIDLAALDVMYRILALLGTGVILFLSSAWFTRSVRTRHLDCDIESQTA